MPVFRCLIEFNTVLEGGGREVNKIIVTVKPYFKSLIDYHPVVRECDERGIPVMIVMRMTSVIKVIIVMSVMRSGVWLAPGTEAGVTEPREPSGPESVCTPEPGTSEPDTDMVTLGPGVRARHQASDTSHSLTRPAPDDKIDFYRKNIKCAAEIWWKYAPIKLIYLEGFQDPMEIFSKDN